jgi:DNA-directed RNA polymerase subunit RPC12/RpoP
MREDWRVDLETGQKYGPIQYGSKWWCIKVPRTVSDDGEIFAFADSVHVLNGTLALMQGGIEADSLPHVTFALAPGQWNAVYAASMFDESPVCVERWAGEIADPRGEDTDRKKRKNWRAVRKIILERAEYKCHYCGAHATDVDHVIPRVEGGTDDESNLVASCKSCNSKKHANSAHGGI